MKRWYVAGLLGLTFGGCNQLGYHYAAWPQPYVAPLYADYLVDSNEMDVSIDTHKRPLVDAYISKADGSIVRPTTIDSPQVESRELGGLAGDGGATDSTSYGVEEVNGPVKARFDKAAVGDGPWNLHIVVTGAPEATIHLGA